ncbi:MAG TPA: hypothetical protein VKC51_03345 [Lacunisphaera sp.]|nr:hypothetical protein [Lacunisphaera sp.]
MKTQISKASHGLAKYSEEYRQQALELWRKRGRSANKVVAAERRWPDRQVGLEGEPLPTPNFGLEVRLSFLARGKP